MISAIKTNLSYLYVILGLVMAFFVVGLLPIDPKISTFLFVIPVVGSAISMSPFFVAFSVAVGGFFAYIATSGLDYLLWAVLTLSGGMSLHLVRRERRIAQQGWAEYHSLADQHVATQDQFDSYSNRLIRKNQELEKRINELTTLYGLSNSVSSTTDLKRIYADICESVAKLTSFDCFVFFETDSSEKTLVVRETSGVFSPWRTGDTLQFHQGLIGRYASWGQVALIEDVKLQTQARATSEEEWFKALMIIPISVDGQLLAAMVLARAEDPPFTRNELYIVQSLACQIGTTIHRAWLYKRLESMAITDGLTGLYNRRHMEETLRKEFARAERYQAILSVALIDVDHFKHYNDTNGHQEGDKLLQHIARILQECIREVDMAARYGGEEFILILPQTQRDAAFAVAERIRTQVMELDSPGAATQPLGCLSLSIGIASYPQDATDPDALVKYADSALYSAKSSGRNQVLFFQAD